MGDLGGQNSSDQSSITLYKIPLVRNTCRDNSPSLQQPTLYNNHFYCILKKVVKRRITVSTVVPYLDNFSKMHFFYRKGYVADDSVLEKTVVILNSVERIRRPQGIRKWKAFKP